MRDIGSGVPLGTKDVSRRAEKDAKIAGLVISTRDPLIPVVCRDQRVVVRDNDNAAFVPNLQEKAALTGKLFKTAVNLAPIQDVLVELAATIGQGEVDHPFADTPLAHSRTDVFGVLHGPFSSI
jgi:hypothetical protein